MRTVEDLRLELKLVSEASPKGCRVTVAEKVGISRVYESEVRRGVNATADNDKNRELIKKMIDAYRQILRDEQRKIEKIFLSEKK